MAKVLNSSFISPVPFPDQKGCFIGLLKPASKNFTGKADILSLFHYFRKVVAQRSGPYEIYGRRPTREYNSSLVRNFGGRSRRTSKQSRRSGHLRRKYSHLYCNGDWKKYGKLFGKDPTGKRYFLISLGTRPVRLGSGDVATGKYEKLVFGRGGEPGRLFPDRTSRVDRLGGGTTLAIGFSGFRGFNDIDIVQNAVRKCWAK